MADPAHVIEIHKDHAEFVVRIEPRPDGPCLNGSFVLKRDAVGYASGLKLVRRWPIRDLTGEPA